MDISSNNLENKVSGIKKDKHTSTNKQFYFDQEKHKNRKRPGEDGSSFHACEIPPLKSLALKLTSAIYDLCNIPDTFEEFEKKRHLMRVNGETRHRPELTREGYERVLLCRFAVLGILGDNPRFITTKNGGYIFSTDKKLVNLRPEVIGIKPIFAESVEPSVPTEPPEGAKAEKNDLVNASIYKRFQSVLSPNHTDPRAAVLRIINEDISITEFAPATSWRAIYSSVQNESADTQGVDDEGGHNGRVVTERQRSEQEGRGGSGMNEEGEGGEKESNEQQWDGGAQVGGEEGTGEEEVRVNGGLENVRNKQSRLRERREKEKNRTRTAVQNFRRRVKAARRKNKQAEERIEEGEEESHKDGEEVAEKEKRTPKKKRRADTAKTSRKSKKPKPPGFFGKVSSQSSQSSLDTRFYGLFVGNCECLPHFQISQIRKKRKYLEIPLVSVPLAIHKDHVLEREPQYPELTAWKGGSLALDDELAPPLPWSRLLLLGTLIILLFLLIVQVLSHLLSLLFGQCALHTPRGDRPWLCVVSEAHHSGFDRNRSVEAPLLLVFDFLLQI